MKVSRREFVSTAGCAAAASLCALPSSAVGNSSAKAAPHYTLLDLESNCALPESLTGMRATLGSHLFVSEGEFASDQIVSCTFPRRVIVPAAGAVRPETFSAMAELLRQGTTVLWESAAAFLNSADFAAQKALAKEHFGVSIGEPIEIWQPPSRKSRTGATIRGARAMCAMGHEQIPYIAYHWPREAHVRDFTRALPVSAVGLGGHAIAHWRKIPVALRTNIGPGTLVFLGSPIGPAVHAGDSEAHQLFQSVIA